MIFNGLTWEGHNFLDSIRKDSTWSKVKGAVKERGLEQTFDSIKAAAAVLIQNAFS